MDFRHVLALGFFFVGLIVAYQVWKMTSKNESTNSPILTQPKKSKILIVNYYATWCPASIQFLPIWNTFVEELKTKNPQITTRNMVCEGSNQKQCAFKGIEGYPTVVMYKNKEAITFEGGRSVLNLHKFVEDNL